MGQASAPAGIATTDLLVLQPRILQPNCDIAAMTEKYPCATTTSTTHKWRMLACVLASPSATDPLPLVTDSRPTAVPARRVEGCRKWERIAGKASAEKQCQPRRAPPRLDTHML